MSNKAILITIASLAVLCLAGTALAVLYVFQLPGGGPPFLASLFLQRSARAAACSSPLSLIPGTYQASPAQTVGDYVVVTYSVQCTQPSGPPVQVDGYEARAPGAGCGGSGSGPVGAPPAASGPTGVVVTHMGGCGSGTGLGGDLALVTGQVTGSGASAGVTAEVLFANGALASGPIANARFTVLAGEVGGPCRVQVLDATGSVLAEEALSGWMPGDCQ